VKRLFELLLVGRLLFPFFDSPLTHLYSDPQRHWDNAEFFLHPTIMGSSDPYLYQVWLFALRWLSDGRQATVLLGCGLLCALMPVGWYRALRELLPRDWALAGGIVIALIPESIEMYAFFMNETLLLTLLGFCFWLTLRSFRKRTLSTYAFACLLWVCAALTRTFAVPMALLCVGSLWLLQEQRLRNLLVAGVIAAALIVPAGLHAQRTLNFFAPFGNLYLNATYHDSGRHDIAINYGRYGQFQFGSPSFYNPTYYPFSQWTTDRKGIASIVVDTAHGRSDWQRERQRIRGARQFPAWRQRWEEIQYLLFGVNWPNEGRETVLSSAMIWARWLWAPLIVFIIGACWQRWFAGRAWLLPVCSLATLLLLAFQSEGVIEARFRSPLDAVMVATAVCALYYRRQRRLLAESGTASPDLPQPLSLDGPHVL
jgi:Dolichyl-phosphate-mannose-protein mannosyltransferase